MKSYECETREWLLFVEFFFLELPPPSFSGLVMLDRILPVDIESSTVLPLGYLNADPDHGRQGVLDTAMDGPHHCYANPTPYISACPIVRLSPFFGEAFIQVFQHGPHLGFDQAIQ